MAFRKRSIGINRAGHDRSDDNAASKIEQPGVRPSPLTSDSVVSTGTSSLDDLLGGHGGLALGSSLLVEESGTTEFSGALLRSFAAEGICQSHIVHVIGVGETWVRGLPGLADAKLSRTEPPSTEEGRMRIAWRYQKLGIAGEKVLPDRISESNDRGHFEQQPFCHTFDLTKRLNIQHDVRVNHLRIEASPRPFATILQKLSQSLSSSGLNTIHRLIVPMILSPALWPSQASRPENFLHFLHTLRSLLRQYSNNLTAMMTFPLELHPRNSSLVRWAEILSDGVVELTPFPHLTDASSTTGESGGMGSNDARPQGLVMVHKLPISTERGEGGADTCNSIGEDLVFIVTRRKFIIKPFSLPPLEGDQDAQKEATSHISKDIEF